MTGPSVSGVIQHRRQRQSPLPWLKLLGQVVARAYLVFVMALATFALAPMLFGMSATVVHGVSMRPLIVAGDVVLSLPYDQSSAIPLGGVVVFEAPPGSGRTGLIIHRVVSVRADGRLITKGDGDEEADSTTIDKSAILAQGKVLIPWIGLPTLWLGDGDFVLFGVFIAITALAILVEVKRPADPVDPPDPRPRRPAAIAAVVLIAALASGSAVVSQVVFTSRTTSVGSFWSYPAAKPATQLAFTTSPSNSTGGTAFTRQPVVTIEDAQGKRTTGTRTVALSITTPAGATLTCTANPITSASGTVAFAGCAINRPGTYTLHAQSGQLTAATSATFVVSVGPAARMQFATSPSNATTGTAFSTQPTVTIVDLGGNVVPSTSAVTLAISPPTTGTLKCTTNPLSARAGTATFVGCSIGSAGTYTLRATSGTLPSATSQSFVVSAPVIPTLTCQSQIWIATFSWTPTPNAPTVYTLYVNGIKVRATGADGYNSYVQLTSDNVPVSLFPEGSATLEVRQVLANGTEIVIGDGTVLLGPAGYRTYYCG